MDDLWASIKSRIALITGMGAVVFFTAAVTLWCSSCSLFTANSADPAVAAYAYELHMCVTTSASWAQYNVCVRGVDARFGQLSDAGGQ